jgi:hypothetical protein
MIVLSVYVANEKKGLPNISLQAFFSLNSTENLQSLLSLRSERQNYSKIIKPLDHSYVRLVLAD